MVYSALLVAKYIVRRCAERGKSISNLKIQKILYFVQAEFLVDLGVCCFPETIEAWDFGPVVPVVYRAYRIYGSANIPAETANGLRPIRSVDMNRINGIVDECCEYSASQLVEITHHQSPWRDAYHRPGVNNEITPDSIRAFFTEAN